MTNFQSFPSELELTFALHFTEKSASTPFPIAAPAV